MPSILESFGLDSREYQLGKQKVERGLKCFNVTWSDGVSNLEQTCTKKKAHHQNLILQGTLLTEDSSQPQFFRKIVEIERSPEGAAIL